MKVTNHFSCLNKIDLSHFISLEIYFLATILESPEEKKSIHSKNHKTWPKNELKDFFG